MQKEPYQLLLNYAFRLLSRKAYSESEMQKRLLRRALKVKLKEAESAIAKVMQRLFELNYINDAKILDDFFEYSLQIKPRGKFLFLHEMRRRGIPIEIARAAWEKRNIQEWPLALSLVERKKRQFEKLPEILRKKKIAQLLASRGFSPETVWGVLDKYIWE